MLPSGPPEPARMSAERSAPIAVTVAQRARLVLALGVVNLVLAGIALGFGTMVQTGPTVRPSQNVATVPSPAPTTTPSPSPSPTGGPPIAVVPSPTPTPTPTPAPEPSGPVIAV